MMPVGYPVQIRIEYPAGSSNYSEWKSLEDLVFSVNGYVPVNNTYRIQLKHPCNENNIVTSPVYSITYPYNSRSGYCTPSIIKNIATYDCEPVGIRIVHNAADSTERTFNWDPKQSASYVMNLTGLPSGTYFVYIKTSSGTYQTTNITTTTLSTVNTAFIYNYLTNLGCDFTTGGIRSYGISAENTVPITYKILSGPVSRPSVTSTKDTTMWDDLPTGEYNVEFKFGDCGTSTRKFNLVLPFSGFDANPLSYVPGSSCGKYKITGKGWYWASENVISTKTDNYTAVLLDNNDKPVANANARTVVDNNTAFEIAYEVGPGTYKVGFVNALHSQGKCYYVYRYITIPPYQPVSVNVDKSGGIVCDDGKGELHIEIVGGCEYKQIISIIILPSPKVLIIGNSLVCPGSKETYTIDDLSNISAFKWSVTGQGNTITGETISNPDVTWNTSGNLFLEMVNQEGCMSMSEIYVETIPLRTTWTGNAGDSNWNNPQNWNPGIPKSCTYVVIPGGLDYYPELQPAGDNYPQAECDTIEFQAGGEVAKTNYLSYHSAKVELKIPSSNRWYMASPPLRDMYSGDYQLAESFHRWNPEVYMMKYQVNNPQTREQTNAGSWSDPFNTLTENLNPGDGYVIWIEKADATAVSYFHFPKDSTRYNYYYRNGDFGYEDPVTMTRDNYDRFIYETGNNAVPDESFKLQIDGSKETAIVGNPFMSHLDFEAFYNANQEKIHNSYYIWSGGDFAANIITDWGVISTDPTALAENNMIAPMQSFIVNKIGSNFSDLTFKYNMSKTLPTGNTLRSGSMLYPDNMLNLTISKGGERKSGISIHYREGESNTYDSKKDVWTLFNHKEKEFTTLYCLLGGKAASISTMGNLSEIIELGLCTTEKPA